MDHGYSVTVAGALGLFGAVSLEVGSCASPGTQSALTEIPTFIF